MAHNDRIHVHHPWYWLGRHVPGTDTFDKEVSTMATSKEVQTDVMLATGAAITYASKHFEEWFSEMIVTPEYGDAKPHREYWELMLAGAAHSVQLVMQELHAKYPELFAGPDYVGGADTRFPPVPDTIPEQWEEE